MLVRTIKNRIRAVFCMTPANYGIGGYQSLANEMCDNVQNSHVENKFVRSCYDVPSKIIFIQ